MNKCTISSIHPGCLKLERHSILTRHIFVPQAVAAQIELPEEFVYYFCLFLVKKAAAQENESKFLQLMKERDNASQKRLLICVISIICLPIFMSQSF